MKSDPDAKLSSLLSADEVDWVLGHVYEERWISEHEWSDMTTSSSFAWREAAVVY